ncbi:hypothetical protein LIER_41806 [Lithospermum erythrorhizon]|uniref:Uncharacterized protein n=1 Tax=Lithospermum erythrorhizon TaxID=34254 RepID=A0AAV3RGM4_LITER
MQARLLVDALDMDYHQSSLHISGDGNTVSDRHHRSLVDTSSDEYVDLSRPVVPVGNFMVEPLSRARGALSSHGTRPASDKGGGSTARDTATDTGDLSVVKRRGEAQDHSPDPCTRKKEIHFVGDV